MTEPMHTDVPADNEEWRRALLGTDAQLLRLRGIFRRLPHDPRCQVCMAPYAGVGGSIVKLFGYGRYPQNPQLCNTCFRKANDHPGGAVISITALFADVRGSTGLAETMPAGEYRQLMDAYVRVTTRAIRERGGVVDKLLGDGVMALFIPGFVRDADHAGAAVAAAREVLREVELPVGIGVHTGEAWVGFVGGVDGVLEFTALGDPVNSASRMGSLAAGGELLLGDSTVRAAGLDASSLERRQLELRGRRELLDAWAESVAAPVPVKGG